MTHLQTQETLLKKDKDEELRMWDEENVLMSQFYIIYETFITNSIIRQLQI